MAKFLVATCNKDTGDINFKHIDARTNKDVVIEEYIDWYMNNRTD